MWILPTMSRPQQCEKVLQAIGAVSSGIIFINGHSHLTGYSSIELPLGWKMLVNDINIGCIGALNETFRLYPNEAWYGFIADDEFLVSAPLNWENMLVSAADRMDISHGLDDLHHGQKLQGYVVLGGDLVRAVGYLAIKECKHNFGFDDMWQCLAKQAALSGIRACRVKLIFEVKIDHRHQWWAKSSDDECYQKGFSSFEEDGNKFVDWQHDEMKNVLERISLASKFNTSKTSTS